MVNDAVLAYYSEDIDSAHRSAEKDDQVDNWQIGPGTHDLHPGQSKLNQPDYSIIICLQIYRKNC